MNRRDALNTLAKAKAELAGRFGVTRLALFGSTARDVAKRESDIDILVSFPVALFAHFERCRHIHSNITDNNIQKTLGFTAQPTDFPGDKTNPGDIQITMLFGVGWAVKPNVFIGLWGFLECC